MVATSTAMTPANLPAAAKHLLPVGPGRPNHAMLRRSISTAYYALFAALREEVARPYSAQAKPAAWRLPAHGAANDVCQNLVNRRSIPWMEGTPGCNADLLDFAENFLEVQAARHLADYDYGYAPKKSDTKVILGRARDGVRSLESARRTDPEQVQVVCVAMSAPSKRSTPYATLAA